MTENLHFINGDPRIACNIVGEGPPVVFLHGIGGRRQNWGSQIDTLRDNFTCIAWDARGYGDSHDYPGPLAFSDFADDLARLVDQLAIERAHFVGLSMGARILLDFHPRHSERVATLSLCDCFYSFESALSPEKQKEFIELREKPLREGKTFTDLAPKLIDSLVSPNCSAEVREDLHQSIIALRTESYLKTMRASVSFDRGAELADINQPVQLIFGADDRLTPPSIGKEMQSKLSSAELAVIDGAGHLSNLEKPALFNEILLEFLTSQAPLATFSKKS